MTMLGHRILRTLPALMLAGVAANAGAQEKACDIDEGSPNQVARAMLDLQFAQSAKPEDAAAKLKDATKLLTEGDMKKNPTGRAFVQGKTLVMWMNQPAMTSGITTRGAIGLTDNPTASYDLVAGIDSAFTIVESANPECASQTAPWRQQKGWVDLTNKAIELANGGNMDSAAVLAKRSLMLSRNMPYGYMVLAQAAAKNNQAKQAIDYYKQAIAAAKDTSMADTRRQLELQLGNLASEAADATQAGPDKATYISEAKAAYDALAKDPGTKYADAARTGQAHLATLSGDTAAIKASYADQLANPSAFSYSSLMNAAVTAARANQAHDATKLFEAARNVNPYHRDVLYNLARLYLLDSAYDKGVTTAKQLIAVDPSNPDNYQLLAIGYAAIQKGYGAKEKALEDSAKALGQKANTSKSSAVVKSAVDAAARLSPVIKAYSDSTKVAVDSAIKYQTMMTSLPVRVAFTEFTPTESKVTIGGTIENQSDAAKSYTMKLEFLDKSGNVVTTQDVPVGPVPAHGKAPFSVTGTGAGIVAFRYAPLT